MGGKSGPSSRKSTGGIPSQNAAAQQSRRKTIGVLEVDEEGMPPPSSQRSETGETQELYNDMANYKNNLRRRLQACKDFRGYFAQRKAELEEATEQIEVELAKRETTFTTAFQAQLSSFQPTSASGADQRGVPRDRAAVQPCPSLEEQLKKTSESILGLCAKVENAYLSSSRMIEDMEHWRDVGRSWEDDRTILLKNLKLGAKLVQKDAKELIGLRTQSGKDEEGPRFNAEEESAIKALDLETMMTTRHKEMTFQETLEQSRRGLRRFTGVLPLDSEDERVARR